MKRRLNQTTDLSFKHPRRYSSFEWLPLELQTKVLREPAKSEIFHFVNPQDMSRVAQVCRQWNQRAKDEHLWKGFCLNEIQFDLEGKVPFGISSWINYYQWLPFYNDLRRLGTELLSHVIITAGYNWRAVLFRVEKSRDGEYLLHQQVCHEPEPSRDDADVSEAEYGKAITALGITEEYRSLFCSQLVEEIGVLCHRWEIPWDRSLLCLYHSDGKGFSDPVDLVLGQEVDFSEHAEMTIGVSRDSEPENISGNIVKSVRIFPQKCSVNVSILQRVHQVCEHLDSGDGRLRQLLKDKAKTSVDFESSHLRVFQDENDIQPELIPFQVIGTYSPEFLNWRWAWKGELFKPEQYEEIIRIREQSKEEDWPETNLLSHGSIDCELVFAMAIAHLCAIHMGRGTLVYAAPGGCNPNARVFLALRDVQ